MFGPDWLTNLFISFFLFGLIFTIASLALGFVGMGGGHTADAGGHHIDVGGHHVDIGGHDAGHDVGHAGAHDGGHATSDGPSVLNMPTIMAFITWFGGVGWILRGSLNLNGYVAAGLAIISGIAGGTIMFFALARVLWPMMSKPLEQADYRLPGTSARVVSAIRAGGIGEIVYTKGGSRFTAGARSLDGHAVSQGAEVVIIEYERGIAIVQDVHRILDDEHEDDAREGATTASNS